MESALLGWAAGWLQACLLYLRRLAQKMSESTLGCDPASKSGLTELKCHQGLQGEGRRRSKRMTELSDLVYRRDLGGNERCTIIGLPGTAPD